MSEVVMKKVNLGALSWQGAFPANTSLYNLAQVFGYPDVSIMSSAIDALWEGEIDGEPFTIYNYRTGKAYLGEKGPPIDKITEWNIGGSSPSVVQKLIDHFNERIQ
jgi:hypothetical protein